MKKFLCLMCMVLIVHFVAAQSPSIIHSENFDGIPTITGTGWVVSNSYSVSGTNSIHGAVPNLQGDSIVLTTPTYDLTAYEFVSLRFSHICKVSSSDEVRVEYKDNSTYGSQWQTLPQSAYTGNASNYGISGFSAASYTEWNDADSLAIPAQSWWKEEFFDLRNELSFSQAQFRFIIKKGAVNGSNVSYGWLIDNIEVSGSTFEKLPPTCEFIAPFYRDTLYSTGPYTIRAKVKTNTAARLNTPYLKRIHTYNNVTTTDSVLMTNVSGDSIWEATIGQYLLGSEVLYSIYATDTTGNYATAASGYVIAKPAHGGSITTGYVYYEPADTTGATSNNLAIIYHSTAGASNQSRSLYLSSELGNSSQPIYLSDLAWYNRTYNYTSTRNINIYMLATTDVSTPVAAMDPVTSGATLVYSGSTTSQLSWNEVTFPIPFVLPAGSNLYVFFEDNSAVVGPGIIYWAGHLVASRCVYNFNGTWTSSTMVPLMRFGLGGGSNYDSNSVALTSINSPVKGGAVGGVSTPINITIRNRGDLPLTSATINCSINGVAQTPYAWTGNLPWDFETSLTIGNYTPTSNGFDTIVVAISNPNGQLDSVLYDDTLEVISYGCAATISGSYVVGANGDFPSVASFLDVMNLCYPAGDISLKLATGVYVETWDLSNISSLMGNYTLTITSLANDRDSVIIRPTSGNVITLANTNNLRLEAITVDAETAAARGIIFTGACQNVTINNCNILAEPSGIASTSSAIHKASGTGLLDNIVITNNLINGGYYGIYLYAGTGTTAYGTNIRIDSNIISNQYYYATYFYYANFNSLTHNTCLSRTENTSTYWYALRLYRCDADSIQNNHIQQRSTSITYPYGMYLYYVNYGQTALSGQRAMICNNEIMLNTTGTYYGMYCGYSELDIYYNSILITGSGASRGIYVASNASNFVAAKANNIVLMGTSAHPVYISSTTAISNYDFSNNNYYAPTYVGFAGSAYSDLTSWSNVVTTETGSINVLPDFIDSTINLELSNYDNVQTNLLPAIRLDINGAARGAITAMGCYRGFEPFNKNVSMISILGIDNSHFAGQSDSVYVEITNGGVQNITAATIAWSLNGIAQTSLSWSGNLATLERDTITLTNLVYTGGQNNITVWFDTTGGLSDDLLSDDTISVDYYICDSAFNGYYTIGTGGNYTNPEDFFTNLSICGISGPVTVAYLPGTNYTQNIQIGSIPGSSSTNVLTITSSTGDSSDVVIFRADDATSSLAPFMLKDASNIVIKNLTLSGVSPISGTYTYSHSIIIEDSCSNIEVSNCWLYVPKNFANPVTGTNQNPVRIKGNTGMGGIDNIRILNNLIEGGSCGVYVYGVSSSNYINNIVVKDNQIGYVDAYGVYCYYSNNVVVEGNNIRQREGNFTPGTFSGGVYAYYSNVDVLRNKIWANGLYYGIYTAYLNYNQATDSALIANNEIIGSRSSGIPYGIYVGSSSKAKIYHNSVSVSSESSSVAYGLYVISAAQTFLDVKNNIFLVEGMNSNNYPIYLAATTYINQWGVNSNVYYNKSTAQIGYAGGAKTSLSAWQASVPSDVASVNVLPNFLNESNSLLVSDSNNISCASLPEVPIDIESNARDTLTTRGAYHYGQKAIDVSPYEFISPSEIVNASVTTPVTIVLRNAGLDTITSANISWSVNGVNQTVYNWTGNLLSEETDTVILGSFTPSLGSNNLVAWTSNPNNTTDLFVLNDTLRIVSFGCSSALRGTYTVGNTGTYATIADAVDAVTYCGIDSAVVFSIQAGTYTDMIEIGSIPGANDTNTLTITSATGIASDVNINVGQTALSCSNTAHVYFQNISIYGSVIGVELSGTCRDVEFRNCNIGTSRTATNAAYRAISYPNTSGSSDYLSDVRFIGNTIYGGFYNMYLYYTSGSSANMNLEDCFVTIDSNTFEDAYSFGLYSYYYNYYKSISYNTITTRVAATTQYGLYLYYYNTIENGVIGNKIKLNGTSTAYGVYAYYTNVSSTYGSDGPVLIANNEIRKLGGAGTTDGFYTGYGHLKLFHNSVYLSGTGTLYGMRIAATSSTYSLNAQNNILSVFGSGTVYPIYTSTATYVTNALGTTLDHNDYYSSGANIGYAGSAKTTLADWQTASGQDESSVNANPLFNDVDSNLSVAYNQNLETSVLADVPTTIVGTTRMGKTTMGAYEMPSPQYDISLDNFIGFDNVIAGVVSPISVVISNNGLNAVDSATIEFSINGVAQVPFAYHPATPLAYEHQDTIVIASPTFTIGTNTIVAVANMVNDTLKHNDTITESRNVCNHVLSGNYTIGASAGADFATWAAFATDAISCGVTGDITLAFESGTYTGAVSLANLTDVMGEYTLTITSLANNRDSVIFSVSSGVLLTLNNTENLLIKDVTLDAVAGTYTVQFAGPTANITFDNCNILASPTATTSAYAAIYKTSSTGKAEKVTIKNSTIDGGYYGIYLYSTTANSISDVIVDSNIVSNSNYYGIYLYYASSISTSYNVVTPRSVNQAITWYGINLYQNKPAGNVIGNRIYADNSSITSILYGLRTYYVNDGLVANNDIVLNSSAATTYGIYVDYTNDMEYAHNTVSITGSSNNARALYWYVYSNATYDALFHKNIFSVNGTGTAPYAVYFAGTYSPTYASYYNMDNNAYYSHGSFGYAGGILSTLSDWQTTTSLDSHSVYVQPSFTNTNSGELNNYIPFLTTSSSNVLTDITGRTRTNPTAMGAYQAEFDTLDAALSTFDNLNIQVLQNSPVNVSLYNVGLDTLTTATINWSVDGVTQTAVSWTGNLSLGAEMSVLLGNVNLPAGIHTITAWLSSANGVTDHNTNNDTISETMFVCNGALAGTYTVGSATADFATLEAALIALNACGIDSSVVFEFANGSYSNFELTAITGSNDTNTVTFTSMSGNANDVEFVTTSSSALLLANTSNLVFKNVTFDAEAGTTAVLFSGTNTNIEFYQCNIKADPSATTNGYAAVRYANSSGSTNYIDDIRFIKNNISGGYYGFYLYYTMGSSANMIGKTGITIDDNTITNVYYYNIYSYYYNVLNSVSHNTINTRAGSSVQYGIYLYGYNVVNNGVIGNKILLNGISTSYGIYAGYYLNVASSGASGNALIANNEIRKTSGAAGVTYGMYTYYSNADIYHNSVHLVGAGTTYGLYMSTTSSSYSLNIKNNIFSVSSSGTHYPIYVGTASYATQAYGTVLDYNDYYSTGAYVGYIAGTTTSLAALQTATGQDVNSINVAPPFVNETISLELNNYVSFLTDRLSNVLTDINGQPRATTTTMGAYSPNMADGYDLALDAILGLPDAADFCSPDSAAVNLVVYNRSLNVFNFATDTLFLHLNVSGQTTLDTTMIITADSLSPLEKDTFELIANLGIYTAGTYQITAWLSNALDTLTSNDTLTITHYTNKVSLPLDVDFSNGIPLALRTEIVTGTSDFYVLSDSNAAGNVIPQYSNKMLAFDGTRGSSARLFTRQLDLTGTSNPLIEFWYWHDSSSSASNDYTDVRLTFDGGATYTTLFPVTKHNANLDHGWTKYTYDLSQYTQNSCIIVVFESMRMSSSEYDGEQYIDRIRLVSDQDLAVGKLVAPAIDACNQTADLEIILENMTSQVINFASYPTSLKVDITGAITQSYTIPLNSGSLASLATDTITIATNFNFAAGTYYAYARLLTAIDNTPANDEMRDTLVVNPELTVAATAVTGGNGMTNCIVAGSKVAQVVNITNSGNMDMEDLVLTLSVNNESGVVVETITDTILGTFAVNATVNYTFSTNYTVPTGGELYNVQVVVAPLCNAAMDFDNIITECVDLSDIEIVAILAPDASSTNCDAVGSTIKVKAQLRNNHPNDDFQNIVIHAKVTANSGASLGSWTETINEIQAGSTLDFEFPQSFTVPNEANYTVKVYVNNIDGNTSNDTLSVTKCTDLGIGEGDVNGISMSQNIPNPASSNAKVNYSVPTSGKVVFTLTTVTGQIIYSESTNVEAGAYSIEFNTSDFANGIYFYIMDFNGQRLVKKMSVKN